MIYAVGAVGSEFIKFGKTKNISNRLKQFDTGSPFELEVLALADWEDGQESAVHLFLAADHQRLEWFKASENTSKLIAWMNDKENGLLAFQHAFRKQKPRDGDWRTISRRNALYGREERRQAKEELAGWRKNRSAQRRLLSRTRETLDDERRRAQRAAWWRENGPELAVAQQTLDPVKNQYPVSADSSIIMQE